MENILKLSKETLDRLINDNEVEFFGCLYNYDIHEALEHLKPEELQGLTAEDIDDIVYEQIYYHSEGDGNALEIVFEFELNDNTTAIVLLEGTYSSWDSNYYDSCGYAEPYTFTETRYKLI